MRCHTGRCITPGYGVAPIGRRGRACIQESVAESAWSTGRLRTTCLIYMHWIEKKANCYTEEGLQPQQTLEMQNVPLTANLIHLLRI